MVAQGKVDVSVLVSGSSYPYGLWWLRRKHDVSNACIRVSMD